MTNGEEIEIGSLIGVVPRVEPGTLKTTEIMEKLHSREELDQAGFRRKVYTYNGISFSFRGREELPIIPPSGKNGAQLLGSEPVNIGKDDFRAYKDGVESRIEGEGARNFIVTKDLEGVISLAIQLGGKDLNLELTLQRLRKGEYSGRALDLIDQLVACNWISERGEWIEDLSQMGADAEAIVVLSLLGNQEAQDYINGQLEKMRGLDAKRERKWEDDWLKFEKLSVTKVAKATGLDIKKFIDSAVAVHVTQYPLKKCGGYDYEVLTTGDATDWEILRNTVHVSLNQRVGEIGADWRSMSYAVISPFRSMLEENGTPLALNSDDTWWTRNPGEPLKFTDASLVEPGEVPEGEYFVVGERSTKFKASGYRVEDIENYDILPHFLAEAFIHGLVGNTGREKTERKMDPWDRSELTRVFGQDIFDDEGVIPAHIELGYDPIGRGEQEIKRRLLDNPQGSIYDKVLEILNLAEIDGALKKGVTDRDKAVTDLARNISSQIERNICAKVQERAIEATIEARGFSKDWSGVDPRIVRGLGAWAESGSLHGDTDLGQSLSRKWGAVLDATVREENGIERFDWARFEPGNYPISVMDSKTRRALYASGAFNSRA